MYRAKVEDLSALLVDPQLKAEAFDIIRGLIDEVRLVREDGELRIDLRGELAGILNSDYALRTGYAISGIWPGRIATLR